VYHVSTGIVLAFEARLRHDSFTQDQASDRGPDAILFQREWGKATIALHAANLKAVEGDVHDLDRALDFLRTHGLKLRLVQRGNVCPPGDQGCIAGIHEHGIKYTVIFSRDVKSFPKTEVDPIFETTIGPF
jgi:catechol 2,3-dioxygenase-like lactoylglutathione lyase family enzyme